MSDTGPNGQAALAAARRTGGSVDVIREHLAHLARLNRRPGSIDQRKYTLRRLERFIWPTPLLEVSLDELRDFVDRPSSRPGTGERGADARASEVSHLRRFFRWAAMEEHRADDPTLRLERPSCPRHHPRPMPNEHVALALAGAPERVRPWLWLAAYAGLRACEIAPLRADDVDHRLIVVRVQKGGEHGVVPNAPALRPVFAALPRSGWLFPHQGRGAPGPTSAGQVSKLSNRWLHTQGITHTLHTLRHWFGTNAYRVSGRDLRRTQELLRHRSLEATQIYTADDVDERAETVARLPVLAPFLEAA